KPGDPVELISQTVFDHTVSSLDRARKTYDVSALNEAVDYLYSASYVTFVGFGASSIIAQDAEQKGGLFEVHCTAPLDAHQQIMAACMAEPGSVFFLISNTGNNGIVLEIADLARQHGATIIGLTGDHKTPLVEYCDVALVAKTYEDTEVFTPMVSRLAGLVVIDVLSAAVAARRGTAHLERVRTMKAELAQFRSAPTHGGTAAEESQRNPHS